MLTLEKAFEYLQRAGRITQETVDDSWDYIKTNRFDTPEYGVDATGEDKAPEKQIKSV